MLVSIMLGDEAKKREKLSKSKCILELTITGDDEAGGGGIRMAYQSLMAVVRLDILPLVVLLIKPISNQLKVYEEEKERDL